MFSSDFEYNRFTFFKTSELTRVRFTFANYTNTQTAGELNETS